MEALLQQVLPADDVVAAGALNSIRGNFAFTVGPGLAGFVYEKLCRRRDVQRYPPLGELIEVGGHRLHLLSKGTEGPTVVIEQGAGGLSLSWFDLQEKIANFASVSL